MDEYCFCCWGNVGGVVVVSMLLPMAWYYCYYSCWEEWISSWVRYRIEPIRGYITAENTAVGNSTYSGDEYHQREAVLDLWISVDEAKKRERGR